MGRRRVGCVTFLGAAAFLFEIAGRLAPERSAGWGWLLLAGLILTGIAVNLWAGEKAEASCSRCGKCCPIDP